MMIIDSKAVRQAMLNKAVGVIGLSKLAKMSSRTISMVYRRDVPVTLSTIAKLAKALEVEPTSLVKDFFLKECD